MSDEWTKEQLLEQIEVQVRTVAEANTELQRLRAECDRLSAALEFKTRQGAEPLKLAEHCQIRARLEEAADDLHAYRHTLYDDHYYRIVAVLRDGAAECDRLSAALGARDGAIRAQDARERQAGERCGVPYDQAGCDWPDRVAEEVIALRAALGARERELEREQDHRVQLCKTETEAHDRAEAAEAESARILQALEGLRTDLCWALNYVRTALQMQHSSHDPFETCVSPQCQRYREVEEALASSARVPRDPQDKER